jgi:hypothetical protein
MPALAINSADDLINPLELRLVEPLVAKAKNLKFIFLAGSGERQSREERQGQRGQWGSAAVGSVRGLDDGCQSDGQVGQDAIYHHFADTGQSPTKGVHPGGERWIPTRRSSCGRHTRSPV